MVRNYKRKKKITEYSEENLQKALEAVRKKQMNSCVASEKYGVPRSLSFTVCVKPEELSSQNRENQQLFRKMKRPR